MSVGRSVCYLTKKVRVMDHERIERLVDKFIEQLEEEFAHLGNEITQNAEGAMREMGMLGLSQEDFPGLVFNLADPMGTIAAIQERCRVHTKNLFYMIESFDPDEEKKARIMIIDKLQQIHSYISSLFSGDDEI